MRFPLQTATLLCGLLLCGAAHAEQTACQRFEQQYAKQYSKIDCVDKDTAVVRNQQTVCRYRLALIFLLTRLTSLTKTIDYY